MPDIATISALFGTIKTATDIAKTLKGVDASLEKAELKLKIAELMESLAEVKIQAIGIQEIIQDKDKEINQLENLLKFKADLRYEGGVYWDETRSKFSNTPYCAKCFEVDNLAIHLTFIKCVEVKDDVVDESRSGNSYKCYSCNNSFIYYP